tara:strand:- start:64102 stop:64347 length:246 start_codon:yes stop_codon:yes gene_type:complete
VRGQAKWAIASTSIVAPGRKRPVIWTIVEARSVGEDTDILNTFHYRAVHVFAASPDGRKIPAFAGAGVDDPDKPGHDGLGL